MKKLLLMTVCAAILCACGGSGSKQSKEPKNESREMAASTLKLKGTHASWFKVEEPYMLRLVKTPEDGWQVRVKINFVKVKAIDEKRYQPCFACCPDIAYIDDNDVEVQEGQLSNGYFNTLCAKEVGESEEIVLQPFSFDELSYEAAKSIYDATVCVQITDMDFEKSVKSKSSKLIDDETQGAIDDMKELIEMEKGLLDALF